MLKNFLIALFALRILHEVIGTKGLTMRSMSLVPILMSTEARGIENYTTCSVTINRYGSLHNFSVDVDIMILQPLNNPRMNTGYYVRLRNSDNWIYNKTFDVCAFLLRPSIDRFSSLVFNEFRRHGSVPSRCPITPGRMWITNSSLTNVRLPAYLPETNFGFVVNVFQGNTPVFRSSWYGRLKKVAL